mmetsp:Transcript_83425/g.239625  ORF Transcript_83425/g.239625 Transcript_83425/m.239625 type:complete len:312 (+) Transcript_83425:129-1064(+)
MLDMCQADSEGGDQQLRPNLPFSARSAGGTLRFRNNRKHRRGNGKKCYGDHRRRVPRHRAHLVSVAQVLHPNNRCALDVLAHGCPAQAGSLAQTLHTLRRPRVLLVLENLLDRLGHGLCIEGAGLVATTARVVYGERGHWSEWLGHPGFEQHLGIARLVREKRQGQDGLAPLSAFNGATPTAMCDDGLHFGMAQQSGLWQPRADEECGVVTRWNELVAILFQAPDHMTSCQFHCFEQHLDEPLFQNHHGAGGDVHHITSIAQELVQLWVRTGQIHALRSGGQWADELYERRQRRNIVEAKERVDQDKRPLC